MWSLQPHWRPGDHLVFGAGYPAAAISPSTRRASCRAVSGDQGDPCLPIEHSPCLLRESVQVLPRSKRLRRRTRNQHPCQHGPRPRSRRQVNQRPYDLLPQPRAGILTWDNFSFSVPELAAGYTTGGGGSLMLCPNPAPRSATRYIGLSSSDVPAPRSPCWGRGLAQVGLVWPYLCWQDQRTRECLQQSPS